MKVDIEKRNTIRRKRDREECPLHRNMHSRIDELGVEVKKKVPIWTVPVLVTLLLAVLGAFMNHHSKGQDEVKVLVEKMANTLSEVRMNQRLVIEELDIEYQYYDHF